MGKVKPITPDDVVCAREWPDEVIDAWNRCIADHWDGSRSRFQQGEIISYLEDVGISRSRAFSERLLDVEPLYRAEGWSVTYNKPAYNETLPASFEFTWKE